MSLKRDEDACGACDPAAPWGPRLHPCRLTAELLLCPQIRRGASEPARRQAAPSHQDAPTAAPSAHPAIRRQFAIVSEWDGVCLVSWDRGMHPCAGSEGFSPDLGLCS